MARVRVEGQTQLSVARESEATFWPHIRARSKGGDDASAFKWSHIQLISFWFAGQISSHKAAELSEESL